MAEAKSFGGLIPLPASPEIANLRDRETALIAEIAKLAKMDPNQHSSGGHDLLEVKRRTELQLVEIRKALQEATK